MRVAECDWSPENRGGKCVVEKLGPVLGGRAGFTVEPTSAGSRVEWFEDVTMERLPRFLSPLARTAGVLGFRFAM